MGQLPATVISQSARDLGLNISWFERLMKKNVSYFTMLKHQWRMHPTLRMFPSKQYYDDQLIDAKTKEDFPLEPYRLKQAFEKLLPSGSSDHRSLLIDVQGTRLTQISGTSLQNQVEAEAIVNTAQKILSESESSTTLGIITPYSAQKALIRKLMGPKFNRITVETVDGFQGQERDIILVSTVCSPSEWFYEKNNIKTSSFFRDPRRLNVSLTRARTALIVFGSKRALEDNQSDENNVWAPWVTHLVEKSAVFSLPAWKRIFLNCIINPQEHNTENFVESVDSKSMDSCLKHTTSQNNDQNLGEALWSTMSDTEEEEV